MADVINKHDAATMHGAIYFIVGKGTEGGPHSYELSVAGITGSSKPGHQWGDVNGVAANSGYSIGTIQVDLGQRGDWPLGSTKDLELKPGEKSYIDAIVDESSAYARQNGLKFTSDMDGLRSDLHTHGKNLKFIDKDTLGSINKWAASDEGRKWIHDNIDYPQSKSISDKDLSMVNEYGKNIPENRRLETISIIAKTENQIPGLNARFEEALKNGGDYDSVLSTAEKIRNNPRYSYYAGLSAADKAEAYVAVSKDIAVKESLDRASAKVAGSDYNPASEKIDVDIKTALKVVGAAGLGHQVEHDRVLKQGLHNEQVQKLQAQLGELGCLDNTATPDGKYGPATRDAVKAYQHDHHLPEVGQVGPATQKAIQADLQALKQHDKGASPAVPTVSDPVPRLSPPLDPPALKDFRHPDHPLNARYQLFRDALGEQGFHQDRPTLNAAPEVRGYSAEQKDRLAAGFTAQVGSDRQFNTEIQHFAKQGGDLLAIEHPERLGDTPLVLAIPEKAVLSRSPEQHAAAWRARELPEPQAVDTRRVDPKSLSPEHPGHPDHPRHAMFEHTRAALTTEYARWGMQKGAEQLDRETVQVMTAARAGKMDDVGAVRLLPNRDEGRIGEFPTMRVFETAKDAAQSAPSTVFVEGRTLQQAPPVQQSAQQFQQVDQQVTQQVQQDRQLQAQINAQAQQGPVLGGPGMGR